MIPSGRAETTMFFNAPVYSGQFSDDGNFFFACGHDFKVRLYDTSNPYMWKHYKTADHPYAQWTLTDASLSPDNKWLAYTSLTPSICLTPTDPLDEGDPYTLDLGHNTTPDGPTPSHFGIMSVRFSGDGRELIAGTNAHSIAVYDIETRRVLNWIEGHNDDVNAVCFADKSSPHILYSGSDDSMVKVSPGRYPTPRPITPSNPSHRSGTGAAWPTAAKPAPSWATSRASPTSTAKTTAATSSATARTRA
ncbi:hypothetical protein IMZ48_23710 [Candidatus Bathyarchaeota archaeon]|nr:hypothetical protein [Candidatus Bathyarchaeota archaeon]